MKNGKKLIYSECVLHNKLLYYKRVTGSGKTVHTTEYDFKMLESELFVHKPFS